jgi:hypothetical protein
MRNAALRNRDQVTRLIGQRTEFRAGHLRTSKGWDGTLGRLDSQYVNLGLRSATYVVWSYGTPIAWLIGDSWVIPQESYSQSTSRHQQIVRRATS